MLLQERAGNKVIAAWMAHGCPELHCLRHMTIDGLRLNCSARVELAPVPLRNAASGAFDTTTQAALVCPFLFCERVVGVTLHPLDCFDINRALRFRNHLFPAFLSRAGRASTLVEVQDRL